MDLNQAMQFISWDEGRRSKARAETMAGQKFDLTHGLAERKHALGERKFAFDYAKEIQRQREKEIENDKYVISSLTQSYNQAPSLAAKNAIRASMNSYYSSLDSSVRPALDAYIKHSPLSPMQKKHNEFMRVNKPPREPSVEDYKDKNYSRIAEYGFAQADMKAKYDNFMTGTPIKRTDFLSLGEGNAAIRDDNKRVQILTAEELGLKDLAKKYDTSEGELLASGGWTTSKEPMGSFVQGGQWINRHSQINAFTGKTKTLDKPGASVAVTSQITLPAATTKMIQGIISGDKENLVAMKLREMIESSPQDQALASAQLSSLSPGFNFSFRTEKASIARTLVNYIPFVGWLFKDAKTSIGVAVTEGIPTRLPVPGYKEKIVFIDRYGKVRNKYGTVLGSSAEEASNRLSEELGRKR